MKRNILSRAIIILQFLIFTFVGFSLIRAAAGDLDPLFNPGLLQTVYLGGTINKTKVSTAVAQPDGKVLIGGNFKAIGKFARQGIARLNADGSVDTSFVSPGFVIGDGTGNVSIDAITLQADGKILIGGNFLNVAGVYRPCLARLNADGSLDATFNAGNASPHLFTGVLDIDISADAAKITVGGTFVFNNGFTSRTNAARFFSNGTLDTSFNPTVTQNDVTDVLVLPDDKTWLYVFNPIGQPGGNVYRLSVTGAAELTIPTNGDIKKFALQPDGKVLLGGTFNNFNGFPVTAGLLRLNTDGSIDTSFTPPGINSITEVELLSNGKIFVGGAFTTGGTSWIALLNSNGTLDNSFNYTGPRVNVSDIAVQTDGKIVVGAQANDFNDVLNRPLVRLNANGSLDLAQLDVGSGGRANKIFVQADGKILVGGYFTHTDGAPRNSLARYNADGTLDGSFNPPGILAFEEVFGIDLQPDGVILISTSGGFRKLSPSGASLFNSVAGLSYDIKALPDGRLLVGLNNFLRLVNVNNTFDFSFDVPTDARIRKILIQPDGKIIVAGEFTLIKGTTRGRIARVNMDGTLDASFNPIGGANFVITDIALQPDGKIVIVGPFTGVNFNTNYKYVARMNSDGSLDTAFHPIVDNEVSSVKLQPDGKILIGGIMTTVNGTSRKSMARLNADGSLDTTFNLGLGTDDTIANIELQTNGKILIGGKFLHVNGVDRLGVARLSNDLTVRTNFDYDGDGKADVSVFRPSENKWYILRSSDFGVTQQVFAIAGDLPVPADYDGDGKTDFAIFRPSSGDWWYSSSINGAQIFAHWGANGDVPRPSDFDGDGRADYVVFRPSDNFWYRISSANGASSNAAFGLAGDKPVTGDFDGDGKSDKAIFRPSSGDWWYQSSINGAQLAVHWGISTDVPAPADFDGDGKTDFCVYRPSTGTWYIINSNNGSFTIMNFGISEDKPVPADYDGDGKADIAVFRPSSGTWYLQRSTQGFTALQFGIASDIPTENAFVP